MSKDIFLNGFCLPEGKKLQDGLLVNNCNLLQFYIENYLVVSTVQQKEF